MEAFEQQNTLLNNQQHEKNDRDYAYHRNALGLQDRENTGRKICV
jgi:hypothetical protein